MVVRPLKFALPISAVFLAGFLFLAGTPLPVQAAGAAKRALHAADSCTHQLLASKQKRRFRHHWLRCLKRYQRVSVRYAGRPEAGLALYRMGEVSLKLYAYSGNPKDLNRAVTAWQNLAARYPRHPRTPDALLSLARLYLKHKGDRARAVYELERLTRRYGGSRAGIRGKALLATLKPSGKVSPRPIQKTAKPAETRATIQGIRTHAESGRTRIVVQLDREVRFTGERLTNPERLFFDITPAFLPRARKPVTFENGIVRKVRLAQHDPDTVRVVLHITRPAPYSAFTLDAPPRLVIEVGRKPPQGIRSPSAQSDLPPLAARPQSLVPRIVIDAGHGGEDPGAIGPGGLREKDLTLDIAQRLARLVRERLGWKPLLTRKDDTFIPLRDRTRFANKHKADLFISIHLNAHRNRRVRGIETYVLDLTNDQRSLEVAARENGMRLEEMNDLEALLTHLTVDAKKDQSLRLAHYLQRAMVRTLSSRYRRVSDLGVKQGPFWVLYGATMPSVLAEVSFISNPTEAKRLTTPAYRQAIAEALLEGLKTYEASTRLARLHP